MRGDAAILSLRVRDLEQVKGTWHAFVTCDGHSMRVDKRYGVWRVTPEPEAKTYRLVTTPVAIELQRLLRKLERSLVQSEDAASNHHDKENDMPVATQPETTTPPGQKDAATKAASHKKGSAKPAKAKGSKTSTKAGTGKAAAVRGNETMDKAVAATPKGKANAINANKIADILTEKRGKKVWPMPVKAALEKAVALKRVKSFVKDGKTLYHT